MLLGCLQVAPGGVELRPRRSQEVRGSHELQNGGLRGLEEAWGNFLREAFFCQVWSFSVLLGRLWGVVSWVSGGSGLDAGGRRLGAGAWKLVAGGSGLEAGGWRLEAEGWRLEAGGWRLEAGGWGLEAGRCRLEAGG